MTLLRFSFLLARRQSGLQIESLLTCFLFSSTLPFWTFFALLWFRCQPESFATTLSRKRRRWRLLLWVECAAVRDRVAGFVVTGFGELCSRVDWIVRWFDRILLLLRPQGIDRRLSSFRVRRSLQVVRRLRLTRQPPSQPPRAAHSRPFRCGQGLTRLAKQLQIERHEGVGC